MTHYRQCKSFLRTVTATAALATASIAQVPGYTITTVGNFGDVYGIAIDAAGNLYVCYGSVQKVSTSGTTSVVAGGGQCNGGLVGDGGPATAACLSAEGAAVDAAGNLYIADTGNNRIRKVSTNGTITTIAGPGQIGILGDGGPATSASLSSPRGVAVDAAGNLYIADSFHNIVRKVTPDGTINTFAGQASSTYATPLGDGGPATSGALSGPGGLALDAAGSLYIADSSNNRIRKVSAAGIITTVAGNGSFGYSGDGGLAILATMEGPWGIAVDPAGSLYFADNDRVRLVTPNGIINAIAGGGSNSPGNNGPATNALLQSPVVGVASGGGGKVYVSGYPPVLSGAGVRLLTPSSTPVFPVPSIAPTQGTPGVVSASGWGQFTQLGLGSWVSIYGSYLASDSRSWAGSDFNGINAPTSLDDTSVTIGGQPAFVSYISPGQINAQVPTNIGTGPQPLIIKTANGSSSTYSVTVNAQEPGLLAPASFQIHLTQYVAALFQDGFTFVLPVGAIPGVTSRPAKAGDVITLYGIGFGSVVPNTPAGEIVQTAATLASSFHLIFDSTEAKVSYAGLAPGSVGLYQFNVTVPTVTPFGGTSLLTFTLGGVSGAQSLYIAVQ